MTYIVVVFIYISYCFLVVAMTFYLAFLAFIPDYVQV